MKNVLIKNSILFILFFLSTNLFSQSYEDLKKDTANFFSLKVNLNKYKFLDEVFSSKRYMGDRLFFFINKKKVLETRNFSEDGGFVINRILPMKKDAVIKIETSFPDRGDSGAVHYIDFKNNKWILTKTMYYVNYWDKRAIECKCWVVQNISLKKLADSDINIKEFPAEKERKKKCVFTYP